MSEIDELDRQRFEESLCVRKAFQNAWDFLERNGALWRVKSDFTVSREIRHVPKTEILVTCQLRPGDPQYTYQIGLLVNFFDIALEFFDVPSWQAARDIVESWTPTEQRI